MNRLAYVPQSKSQTHITPDRVWDMISDMFGLPAKMCKELLYDPCPAYTPYKAPIFFNGLYGDWPSYSYVNPPFEHFTLTAFVKKAVEQSKKGKWSVMLLSAKTDQDWFHDIILKNNYHIKWIRSRLKFKNNKHYAYGSHFLVLIK